MKHQSLHELAKFGAGLIAGDFLGLLWLAVNGGKGSSFMGIAYDSNMLIPALIFDAAIFIILVHYGWHIGKTPMLRERSYLMIAGTIFAVISLAHLVRIFAVADIVIMGWAVPLWLSWVGTGATAYLSYMSFRLALKMNK